MRRLEVWPTSTELAATTVDALNVLILTTLKAAGATNLPSVVPIQRPGAARKTQMSRAEWRSAMLGGG